MKKTKEEVMEETVEEATPIVAPSPIVDDFHREDLNALRDAVNYLLAKGE